MKQVWEMRLKVVREELFLDAARRPRQRWLGLAELPKGVLEYCNVVDPSGKCDALLSDVLGHQPEAKLRGNMLYLAEEIDVAAKGPSIYPEVAEQVKALEEALKGMSYGGGHWLLVSFGFKDADLEPEGCTGIEKIVSATARDVTLEIGGRKSASDPTYESGYDLTEDDISYYSSIATEIVAGSSVGGGGDGGEWYLTDRFDITVRWRPTIEETANAVVAKANTALAGFRREVALVDKFLNELSREIERKYDRPNLERGWVIGESIKGAYYPINLDGKNVTSTETLDAAKAFVAKAIEKKDSDSPADRLVVIVFQNRTMKRLSLDDGRWKLVSSFDPEE